MDLKELRDELAVKIQKEHPHWGQEQLIGLYFGLDAALEHCRPLLDDAERFQAFKQAQDHYRYCAERLDYYTKELTPMLVEILEDVQIKQIARMFKCDPANIQSIKSGKTWNHVKNPVDPEDMLPPGPCILTNDEANEHYQPQWEPE